MRLPVILTSLWLLHAVDCTGSSYCTEQQKYNVTKRIKYRAPMSVRTYVWCLAVPPRCSRWTTEMRDLTRLETEERTMDVVVCCPGYTMRAGSCHPKCPNGRTGNDCTEKCTKGWWGPSCSQQCSACPAHASCSPLTGNCVCDDDWKGERCEKPTEELKTVTFTPSNILTASTATNSIQLTDMSAANNTLTHSEITTVTLLPKETKLQDILTTTAIPTAAVTADTVETTRELPPVLHNMNSTTEKTQHATDISNMFNNSEQLRTKEPFMTTEEIQWTDAETTTTSPASDHITFQPTLNDFVNVTQYTAPSVSTHHTSLSTPATEPNNDTQKSITHTTAVTYNRPKEIWIKPTQKGDSALIEPKKKSSITNNYQKKTKHNIFSVGETTPRTIVVSIIPTSIDHTAGFKKITLSFNERRFSPKYAYNNVTHASTLWKIKPATNPRIFTTLKPTIKNHSLKTSSFKVTSRNHFNLPKNFNPLRLRNISNYINVTKSPKPKVNSNYTNSNALLEYKTLSPTAESQIISNISSTTSPTQFYPKITSISFDDLLPTAATKETYNSPNLSQTLPATLPNDSSTESRIKDNTFRPTVLINSAPDELVYSKNLKAMNREGISTLKLTTAQDATSKPVQSSKLVMIPDTKNGGLEIKPEHITAVAEGGTERNTDNLMSVLSIAGGVMFGVITVAVVIVMMERCRRTRYEDQLKVNEARVRIAEEEQPPPYVRSIFHAPLPDLPLSEKSHYQPISTLDRNLKQFMRPVAATHSVSPIMMESFRGILECHYDHLPPRNSHISFRSESASCQFRSSATPSVDCPSDLCSRQSLTSEKKLPVMDITVETLKYEEATEVDPTTAEPLYAEIPCWRQPSRHATEIVNLNGEAVTEL